jgi:hypothetical protein
MGIAFYKNMLIHSISIVFQGLPTFFSYFIIVVQVRKKNQESWSLSSGCNRVKIGKGVA